MKPPTSDPIYIHDTGRMRTAPPHSPAHWLFALLLMTAVAGALWQHGNAALTVSLLAAVPILAATVYIPYRRVSSLARSIVNCFLFGGAIGWIAWHMNGGYPDKIMVEGLCIASLIFIAGGKTKDYFYLFFISIFLLIYGALIPRMIFLYLAFLALILLLWIALAFRSFSLAGRVVGREIPSRRSRCWHPAVIQLILSGFFFWYIFSLMPLRNNDVPGLFETSFLTERETMLPPEVNAWLHPQKVKITESAKKIHSGTSSEKPTVAGEQGKPTNIPNPKSPSVIEGAGSAASMGKDLVFYVKSPVKLYHLARLYDVYDGIRWTASSRLKKIQIREYPDHAPVRVHFLEQQYSIVKMFSMHLYAGFKPYNFLSKDNTPLLINQLETTFYGARLRNPPDKLPFHYTVSVQMLIPLKKPETQPELPAEKPQKNPKKKLGTKRPPDPVWNENISKQHYLVLPKTKISRRVRRLAAKITAGSTTAYGRALALRDYLRNHYSYRLEAAPVPAGKEAADYFLFELKTGHCEYFACALAVLARAAGLPARVATGFSPGNYNTLSNLFEVYEYHAHAWTQIYIDRLGWLTMDATPPSVLQSRTLPAGLGQLRDPFDDEWKITPPELTGTTQDFLKNEHLKNLAGKDKLSQIDSALLEIVKAQEKAQEKYDGTMETIKKSGKKGWISRVKTFQKRIAEFFRKSFASLRDFFISIRLIVITVLPLTAIAFYFLRKGFKEWKRRKTIRRIHSLRAQAEELWQTDPKQAVYAVYAALRLSLELKGHKRGTRELLDFADHLAANDRLLGEKVRKIFLLYYKTEYSSHILTPEEVRQAISLFDSAASSEESGFSEMRSESQ